jgi:hypothetical protein
MGKTVRYHGGQALEAGPTAMGLTGFAQAGRCQTLGVGCGDRGLSTNPQPLLLLVLKEVSR